MTLATHPPLGAHRSGLIGGAAPKPPKYFYKGNVCYCNQAVQAEEPMTVKGNGRTLSAHYFGSTRADDPLKVSDFVFKQTEPSLIT